MTVESAFGDLKAKLNERDVRQPISFDEFLKYGSRRSNNVFRNIFQLFADMIKYYIGEGVDEYPNDPESINFVKYDCRRLFVEGTDTPFLADRPFANRLVNLARSFRTGAQRNKIYIFEGPTGSGKSTFLNNLLLKFEEYTRTEDGLTYEVIWRIDRKKLRGFRESDMIIGKQGKKVEPVKETDRAISEEIRDIIYTTDMVEVPCPSHDNPILIIPKSYRHSFLENMIDNEELREKIFNRKEYEWVLKDDPCTICTSIYQALRDRFDSPSAIFEMLYARKYQFNRRLGEGISVYNPGDPLHKETVSNPMLQDSLNHLFRDSNAVQYVFSRLARTNNGIYAIMDIKSHNKVRLMNLHGIISDSVHKVEHIEERINSLFLALLNPEDKEVVESVKSMGDRIMRIPIPYVLDYRTEVEIYRLKFGKDIEKKFLPGVLENFAKVVISSRLELKSENIQKWIRDPKNYEKYCDRDLLLLKMDIYTGIIPTWLTEEDRKNFDARTRRGIISESEKDGQDENSISGRKSIELFNEFFSKYAKEGLLIDMSMVHKFFSNKNESFKKIPEGFLDSLVTLYNYNVLQEVKESLYSYNVNEISKDILNYLFAINFETGITVKCVYTGVELIINDEFFNRLEDRLVKGTGEAERRKFRDDVQKEYTTQTLTHEMGVEGKKITETSLYHLLMDKYQYNLKEDVLNPFLENDNFRNGIKDYGTPTFKTYDKKIRRDVSFLIRNLKKRYGYSEAGAQQVCIYVMDNDIPQTFASQ